MVPEPALAKAQAVWLEKLLAVELVGPALRASVLVAAAVPAATLQADLAVDHCKSPDPF